MYAPRFGRENIVAIIMGLLGISLGLIGAQLLSHILWQQKQATESSDQELEP
jgi:hypothetical protein